MLLARQPALAHHVMGGETPATVWQGLLSGLGHPIIGVDHLAFVVGVGLLSGLAGHALLLPCLFIAGTIAGCFAHVGGLNVPLAEAVIILTLCAAALGVAMRLKLPAGVLAALFAAAGFFHGYAYGESIVGAEAGPLAAYMAGFAIIQYGIAVGAALALRAIVGKGYLAEPTAARAAGGTIALVAAAVLVSSLI
jgi:urease accessory protein